MCLNFTHVMLHYYIIIMFLRCVPVVAYYCSLSSFCAASYFMKIPQFLIPVLLLMDISVVFTLRLLMINAAQNPRTHTLVCPRICLMHAFLQSFSRKGIAGHTDSTQYHTVFQFMLPYISRAGEFPLFHVLANIWYCKTY